MPVPDFSPGEVLTAANMNKVGLWLVKTQTIGSAVSSVTVTDAFSADYDNYKIVLTDSTSSAASLSVYLTLGSTVTGYYGALLFNRSNNATPTGAADSNAARFTYPILGTSSGVRGSFDIYQPFLNARTAVNAQIAEFDTVGALGMFNGFLNNTTSYTAFTLTPSTGTITGGTIRVYGYRN